jgi:tRNA (guanine6-N2)-methyltransferase
MNTYFSTFVPGLGGAVNNALERELGDVKITLLLDGLVVYESSESLSKIRDLRFFNNTFVLFALFRTESRPPQFLIRKVLENPEVVPDTLVGVNKKHSTFRIITSEENKLVPLNKNLLSRAEMLIEKKLKLSVNRSLPDLEIWFLTRKEGYGFFGLRITKKPNYEKLLHKGELRPELAHMLCIIADLKYSDILLDPFAGYGAIPIECARSFGVNKIFAGENDEKVYSILREKILKMNLNIVAGRWDALHLHFLAENSIDKIVTDPPWGLYGNSKADIKKLYSKMLHEFARVLKPAGTMVVLTSQKELFEELVFQSKGYKLREKYNILVSGKKAGIYIVKHA